MTAPREPPPADLPRRAHAMLAAYREAHAIPGEVEDRIWSVVGAADAPEPAFDPWDEPASERSQGSVGSPRPRGSPASRPSPRLAASRPSQGSPRSRITWAAATLAAAAMLVLAWQLGGALAERREAERPPSAAVMQGDAEPTEGRAEIASPRRTVTSPPPAPSPDIQPQDAPLPPVLEPASVTAHPQATDASSRPRHSTPSTSEPSPTPPSTFAAERELVAAAWRALALGDELQALKATADHTRRFPTGLLAPERDAIATIARCRQTPTDAPRRATAFHRAHPRSPLAPRVDEACKAPPAAAPEKSPPP